MHFLKYPNGGATSSLLQEIPENAADVAHLGHLHTPSITSGVDLRYINSKTWGFLRHDWKVRQQPRAVVLLSIIDSLRLNYMKHVFIKGSVGTGVGAKPALFSDVRATFFNRVWTPLLFIGYSCCGQTGKAYYATVLPINLLLACEFTIALFYNLGEFIRSFVKVK